MLFTEPQVSASRSLPGASRCTSPSMAPHYPWVKAVIAQSHLPSPLSCSRRRTQPSPRAALKVWAPPLTPSRRVTQQRSNPRPLKMLSPLPWDFSAAYLSTPGSDICSLLSPSDLRVYTRQWRSQLFLMAGPRTCWWRVPVGQPAGWVTFFLAGE